MLKDHNNKAEQLISNYNDKIKVPCDTMNSISARRTRSADATQIELQKLGIQAQELATQARAYELIEPDTLYLVLPKAWVIVKSSTYYSDLASKFIQSLRDTTGLRHRGRRHSHGGYLCLRLLLPTGETMAWLTYVLGMIARFSSPTVPAPTVL